ncbi:MAG: phosphatase [Epsilonproteobacteria bacterium]|nr:phosphatase [Campylobacterota bacterium]
MIGCDLGSNTIRIVQIDCATKERINEFERIVKTGKNLEKSGIISDEAIANILNALQDAQNFIDFNCDKTKCVTTQALRVAKNANSVLEKIKEQFDLDFEIISGEEEAKYTILGVRNSLLRQNINDENFALFDLGGGSTELSYIKNDVINSKSFSFGILNVSEKYRKDLESGIKKEIKPLIDFAKKNKKADFLVATAGTPTTVSAFLQGMDYASYDHQKVNGSVLYLNDFEKAYKRILKLSKNEQERYCGANRSELIKTGILIVISIMQNIGFEKCIVIDDGLREGVALSLC